MCLGAGGDWKPVGRFFLYQNQKEKKKKEEGRKSGKRKRKTEDGMVLQEVPAAKHDDLRLNSGTLTVNETPTFCPLVSTYVLWHTCTPTHTHANKNVIKTNATIHRLPSTRNPSSGAKTLKMVTWQHGDLLVSTQHYSGLH